MTGLKYQLRKLRKLFFARADSSTNFDYLNIGQAGRSAHNLLLICTKIKAAGSLSTVLLLLLLACVDSYKIEDTIPTGALVVEGVFSDQLKRHQILLSRSASLSTRKILREQHAIVTITDEDGTVIPLTEKSPGVYETAEVAAQVEHRYQLHIVTSDGAEYSSNAVVFSDGPGIKDVYARYVSNPNGEGKGIQVYLDSEESLRPHHFYRWNYIETYEVHAPFPSNWIWTGGTNVEFRHDGIDTCYVTDSLTRIMLANTQHLKGSAIEEVPIRYVDEKLHILRYAYSILVQQYCLSAEAYQYWENLRKMSEEQGSLADLQPGSIKGNIVSLTHPDQEVLGYFDVCKVSEKRIKFSAIDFYNDGMKMPPAYRNNCDEITPVTIRPDELPSLMPTFQRTMNIWEVDDMPILVINLLPISCTDCRDQGPTERPDFL